MEKKELTTIPLPLSSPQQLPHPPHRIIRRQNPHSSKTSLIAQLRVFPPLHHTPCQYPLLRTTDRRSKVKQGRLTNSPKMNEPVAVSLLNKSPSNSSLEMTERRQLSRYICPEGIDPLCTGHGRLASDWRHSIRVHFQRRPERRDGRELLSHLWDPSFGGGIERRVYRWGRW